GPRRSAPAAVARQRARCSLARGPAAKIAPPQGTRWRAYRDSTDRILAQLRGTTHALCAQSCGALRTGSCNFADESPLRAALLAPRRAAAAARLRARCEDCAPSGDALARLP